MAESELLFEVATMFRTLLKGISQEWNKKNQILSLAQFRVLYVLSKEGPRKVSQLAHALYITPAAITGITDKLLEEEYIKRERAERDRRVVNISITEKGESIIQEAQEGHSEAIHSFFNLLPEEDMEHLRRIFGTMLQAIDK